MPQGESPQCLSLHGESKQVQPSPLSRGRRRGPVSLTLNDSHHRVSRVLPWHPARCPQDDEPTLRNADAKDDTSMLDGEDRRSSRLQARTLPGGPLARLASIPQVAVRTMSCCP